MKRNSTLLFLLLVTNMVATHLSAQCNAGACLSIENIDIDAGTLDVYMTNQAGCGYCTDAGYADPVCQTSTTY